MDFYSATDNLAGNIGVFILLTHNIVSIADYTDLMISQILLPGFILRHQRDQRNPFNQHLLRFSLISEICVIILIIVQTFFSLHHRDLLRRQAT